MNLGFGENNNSAYFETNNQLYIIDCGFSVFSKIKNKFDFNKYKSINIIITHLHNDHAGSLSQIILYLFFVFNKTVNVFSKCNRIKEYLDITGTPEEAYQLKEESEKLKFIKTDHVKYLDAYGFKIEINNRKIIYTGDSNNLKSFIPYLKDADEFYVDVSKFGGAHLKIDSVLDELIEISNHGTKVYLMHIDDKKYIETIISKNELYFA